MRIKVPASLNTPAEVVQLLMTECIHLWTSFSFDGELIRIIVPNESFELYDLLQVRIQRYTLSLSQPYNAAGEIVINVIPDRIN